MKKLLIASSLAIASFAALADGATYEYPQPVTSQLTRAEVRAYLMAAQARGEVAHGEQSIVVADTGASLSRADVRAALERWRIDGAYLIAESGTEIQACEVTSPQGAAHWQASTQESSRSLYAARNNTRQF